MDGDFIAVGKVDPVNAWQFERARIAPARWAKQAIALCVLLLACAPQGAETHRSLYETQKTFTLAARVVAQEGDKVTLEVEKPELYDTQSKLSLQLAQGVIDAVYLLVGRDAVIGGVNIRVLQLSGDRIVVDVAKGSPRLEIGQRLDIFPKKKNIAVKDFQVIRGRDPTVAQYVQEEVTTALVNSGQFSVLERAKIQSVIEELRLSQTGLVDPDQVKKVGALIGADIILTGTLAATGDTWTGNLRLIDTESGLIISAVNRSGRLQELAGEVYRDSGNLAGGFDDPKADLAGWLVGERLRGPLGTNGYQNVRLDLTGGANGSPGSLAMDFRLGNERIKKKKAIQAVIANLMKRDLYQFKGIEFYIKGSKAMTAVFVMTDQAEDQDEDEQWFSRIVVSPEWSKVSVDFNTLSINKGRAKRMKTDQVLDLQKIESISWRVVEKHNPPGAEGTLWIDEVQLY